MTRRPNLHQCRVATPFEKVGSLSSQTNTTDAAGQTKGKLALMNSETKKEQKLYYVYREGGVIKLAREDWVDKPLAS